MYGLTKAKCMEDANFRLSFRVLSGGSRLYFQRGGDLLLKHITRVRNMQNACEMMKIKKYEWFQEPTQLLIHWQWWSNLSTHQLHMQQCLESAEHITSQAGHSIFGSNFSTNFKNGIYCVPLIKPGCFFTVITKNKNDNKNIAVSIKNHPSE